MRARIFTAVMAAGVAAAVVMPPALAQEGAGQEKAGQERMAGAQAAFFRAADDLPLMPGLRELADEGVVFDQPDGRVVEAVALAPAGMDDAAIRAFYRDTLPQLGWVAVAEGGYVREGEKLTLEVAAPGAAGRIVRLRVAPR